MKIIQIFTGNSYRNFNYLIFSRAPSSSGEVICIDPFDAEQVLAHLKNERLTLTKIINTHGHHDHFAGNEELKKSTGAEILSSAKALGKIKLDRTLAHQETIRLDDEHHLEIILTPGHTDCHLCLVAYANEKPVALFSGDTLFNAGVGNCKNGGNVKELFHSVTDFIGQLPGEVKVYPGHEYWVNNLKFTLAQEKGNQEAARVLSEYDGEKFLVSDLKLEREINTFLRLENAELRENLKLERADSREVFFKLRQLRDRW